MVFNKGSAEGKIPVQYQREQDECSGYASPTDPVTFLSPLYQHFRLYYLDTKKPQSWAPGATQPSQGRGGF